MNGQAANVCTLYTDTESSNDSETSCHHVTNLNIMHLAKGDRTTQSQFVLLDRALSDDRCLQIMTSSALVAAGVSGAMYVLVLATAAAGEHRHISCQIWRQA